MLAKINPYAITTIYLQKTGRQKEKHFWRVYKFFKRQGPHTLDFVYQYLITAAVDGDDMTIKDLFDRAKAWKNKLEKEQAAQARKIYQFDESRRHES